MAAPNIVNVSSIYGKTTAVSLTTTSETDVLNNSAASGKLLKVNMIQVANVDGTSAANITVSVNLSGTSYELVSTVSVPADASLVVIDRNAAIYLEEGHKVTATAATSNDFKVVISYEEIS